MTQPVRVVSWNVASRRPATAKRQGAFLASLEPHIVLLQEVKAASVPVLAEETGLDWVECSLSVRELMPDDAPGRRFGCAIGGARGVHLERVGLLTDVSLPERLLIGRIHVDDQRVTVASYHASPDVNWHEKKPQQAVTFARWLAGRPGRATVTWAAPPGTTCSWGRTRSTHYVMCCAAGSTTIRTSLRRYGANGRRAATDLALHRPAQDERWQPAAVRLDLGQRPLRGRGGRVPLRGIVWGGQRPLGSHR